MGEITVTARDREGAATCGSTRIFWILSGLFVVFRIFYIYRARIDSDEPQHLHIAWSWTRGLLQYRDVFDNHTPLFHLLIAPVVKLIGERPDIIVVMRWTMVPLFLFSLWCVYRLGRALYSREAGLWAAGVAAFFPKFFLVAGQFRSDDLWLCLWLASLVVLVERRLTSKRSFLVGLLLGAAIATSLKTVLLLLALFVALAFVIVFRLSGGRISFTRLLCSLAWGAAGMSIFPLLLLAFYFSQHALPQLFYGTVVHNYVPRLGHWKHGTLLRLLFLPELAVLGLLAAKIWRIAPSIALAERRAAILLAGGVYMALLISFWPLLAPESFLPFYPIAALVVVAAVIAAPSLASRPCHARAIVSSIVALEVILIPCLAPPWRNGTLAEATLLTDVLRLTSVGDDVMDGKGETAFRQRPFYPIFEHITRNRIGQHLTDDSMPRDLISTRTCVVTSFHPFTRADVAFIGRNYLSVGPLSVAGELIDVDASSHRATFDIQIPADYVIVKSDGQVGGELDGTPYSESRFLDAGKHTFVSAGYFGRLAVIWSRALKMGYSPFNVRPWAIPVIY
jgi:4-amino-4-deoxy-L-arabinose transferase-like glycosyltransferase